MNSGKLGLSDPSSADWKLFQRSERSQGDRRSGTEVQESGLVGVGHQFLLGTGHCVMLRSQSTSFGAR